jgi:putative DNA primase/helicase
MSQPGQVDDFGQFQDGARVVVTAYPHAVTPYVESEIGYPLPLAKGKKYPPPTGTTGYEGRTPTDADYRQWSEQYPDGNVGLRLAEGVVGIDVDQYGDKTGGDELARLEQFHGPLPDTWVSTSRPDDVSGIRLFTCSPDVLRDAPSELAPSIELIRPQHRYVVAYPSIHPEGRRYRWDSPDGGNTVPHLEDLPALPAEWIDHIAANGDCRCHTGKTDSGSRGIEVLQPRYGSPSDAVENTRKRIGQKYSTHDSVTPAVMAVLRYVEQLHPDAPAALIDLHALFVAEVTRESRGGKIRTQRDARHEWDSMVDTAQAKIDRDPNSYRYQTPTTLPDTGVSEPFPDGLKYTDADNSERLAHLHRDRIRYVAAWRQWFVWNGIKWESDPDAVLVTEHAKDVSKRLFYELSQTEITDSNEKIRAAAAAWARQSANRSRLDAMVKLAKGIPGILTDHQNFDSDHWAMGVGNGWINLRDGTFHKADPTKLMTLHSDVKWNPEATAPTWERALTQWLPNLEVRNYFQRIVGEASVGAVREHLLILIHGDGGNGKGTAIGALAKTFGPYFVIPDKSLLVTMQGDRHPTEKAALWRKRLAVAAETDHGARLAEAQVKELTGGDQLQARRMYENPWKFWPTHSLWLQTNELPEVEDMGHGVWRRVRVMDWPAHFLAQDADPELSEKLEHELEGILSWIVRGAVAWSTHGLAEPDAVVKATKAYKSSQDLTEQFFEHEGIITGKGLFARAADVNRRWGDWTEQTLGKRRSGQEIKRRLKSAGYTHSGGRGPNYHGFAFPNDEARS